MDMLCRILVILSALAFVLAVIARLSGAEMIVAPEGFVRACVSLSVLAIAIRTCFPVKSASA